MSLGASCGLFGVCAVDAIRAPMGDLLSDREMAEKLQAAIVSLVDGSLSSFSVGGNTYTKLNLDSLQKLFDHYAARAARRRHGIVSHLDFRGNVEDRQWP